jgi:peptidoglycan/LPS O-acetylase OafA/YrhL
VRVITSLPDIDGLRAFAVLSVVLFHLQVPGFEGGYVGVDIFFVISGFLITGLIQQRISNTTFRLSEFYANRVRRLFPAILATVAITTVASVILLQPQMLELFARSAIASIFSLANFVFYFESGYWDSSAELKPLLHLWSLGIEEQFYLFWPLVLLGLLRLRYANYLVGLLLLLGLSLTGCIIYTPIDAAATFYLIPFRAWQFCLGVLALEIWRHFNGSLFLCQVLRSVGLALCAISVYTLGDSTSFPGWQALIPSLGAGLVLIASSELEPSPWLSNSLARWLGRVSYSMYLVHWPPIALYRAYTLSELSYGVSAVLGGVTLLLTLFLHYQVERRFYQRHARKSTGWGGVPAISGGIALLLCVALATLQIRADLVSQRQAVLSAEQIKAYKSGRFQLIRRHCRIDQLSDPNRCANPEQRTVLFIGNSHEPDGFNILASALPDNNHQSWVRFGATNECANLQAIADWAVSTSVECQARLDQLRESSKNGQWQTIVYSARRPAIQNKLPLITILETMKKETASLSVIVIDDYISTKQECASIINQTGSAIGCKDSRHLDFFPGMHPEEEVYRQRVENLATDWIKKTDLLCTSNSIRDCQVVTPDGHPMFIDSHHLTFEFASYIGDLLRRENPEWLQTLGSQ